MNSHVNIMILNDDKFKYNKHCCIF